MNPKDLFRKAVYARQTLTPEERNVLLNDKKYGNAFRSFEARQIPSGFQFESFNNLIDNLYSEKALEDIVKDEEKVSKQPTQNTSLKQFVDQLYDVIDDQFDIDLNMLRPSDAKLFESRFNDVKDFIIDYTKKSSLANYNKQYMVDHINRCLSFRDLFTAMFMLASTP